MASALKAWEQAEGACLKWLSTITKMKQGKQLFLGDTLKPTEVNVAVFQISGGPEQSQNYQMSAPARQWLADAQLIGRFESRPNAQKIFGYMMNNFPPTKNGDNGTYLPPNQGLPPNVNVFDITDFPTLESEEVTLDNGKDVWTWRMTCSFRVQFGIEKK